MTDRQGGADVFTGWRGVVVALFAAFAIMVCATENLEILRLRGVFGTDAMGSPGFDAVQIVGRPGWERVTAVQAGGAAARAGIATGNLVRFDHAYEANADFAVGRAIGLTVATSPDLHGGRTRHVTVTTLPEADHDQSQQRRLAHIVYAVSTWFALVLGVLAVVRGWGSLTALALGLGMLAYGAPSLVPTWATMPAAAIGMLIAHAVTVLGGLGLVLLPAALYTERVARPSPGWIAVFGGITALWAGLVALTLWSNLQDASYPVVGDGGPVFAVLLVALNVQGVYWCRRGWRDSTGADRGRFVTIMAATLFQMGNGLTFIAISLAQVRFGQTVTFVMGLIGPLLVNLLIPLTLAYAVLRQRVIDLGFAFNRTLVYGTFSAILLGSFGLIEWGVEHLLPEAWVKASAWIDAGAAVLVYLAFHRVHGAVEHRVEQVFFRQWQANEDALRRFVGSAAYFEDTRALARAFADELARFGGDARVAVYRRNDGALDRVGGTWDAAPRHFREDDPAFALMRAERAPLDLEATHTDLPGVLALPMLDHGVLAGLVLMDLKGNGALYRPDEVALLGWAAHEVGLALAALHAGLIETENRLLKAQLARIGSIIGDRLDRVGA